MAETEPNKTLAVTCTVGLLGELVLFWLFENEEEFVLKLNELEQTEVSPSFPNADFLEAICY